MFVDNEIIVKKTKQYIEACYFLWLYMNREPHDPKSFLIINCRKKKLSLEKWFHKNKLQIPYYSPGTYPADYHY